MNRAAMEAHSDAILEARGLKALTPKQQQAESMRKARQAHLLHDLQVEAQRRGWSLWQIRGELVLQRNGFRDRKFPTLHQAQVAVYKLKEPTR